MRTHKVPKGVMPPMPPLIKGDVGRKLQGGNPPEPYRARNVWGNAYRYARNDGVSKPCQAECFHATSEWSRAAKKGQGAFIAP